MKIPSRPQLGLAIDAWMHGVINCIIILAIILAVSRVGRGDGPRRSALRIALIAIILLAVYCTQYVPLLKRSVFDPIHGLGRLF
jgi:hypothetical protein